MKKLALFLFLVLFSCSAFAQNGPNPPDLESMKTDGSNASTIADLPVTLINGVAPLTAAEKTRVTVGSITYFTANDATPSVANGNGVYSFEDYTSNTTVTNFDDGVEGQIITLVFSNAAGVEIVINRTNAYLSVNADFTVAPASAASIMFVKRGAYWFEISRTAVYY